MVEVTIRFGSQHLCYQLRVVTSFGRDQVNAIVRSPRSALTIHESDDPSSSLPSVHTYLAILMLRVGVSLAFAFIYQ